MIIESVRLVNVTAFTDVTLRFVSGINILAGANGAGKSTVIESIGLALFGAWPARHQEGNARTGFLRRGEEEGAITVIVRTGAARFTVECSLWRKKRRGAEPVVEHERRLLDADGGLMSASGGRAADFQQDLRGHLLGDARMDDSDLFTHIVGTAQGTFDAPFVKSERERRQDFETMLGIAEFQTFERQFASLVRSRDREAAGLRGNLEVLGDVEGSHTAAQAAIDATRAQAADADRIVREADGSAAAAQAAADAYAVNRTALEAARNAKSLAAQHADATRRAHAQHLEHLQHAQAAAAALERTRAGYEAHAAATAALETARIQCAERDELVRTHQAVLGGLEKESVRLRTEQRSGDSEIDRISGEIGALEEEERRLAQDVEDLRSQAKDQITAKNAAAAVHTFTRRLSKYATTLQNIRITMADERTAIGDARKEWEAIAEETGALVRSGITPPSVAHLDALGAEGAVLFARALTAADTADDLSALAALVAAIDAEDAAAFAALQRGENVLAGTVRAGKERATQLESVRKKLTAARAALDTARTRAVRIAADIMENNRMAEEERNRHAERLLPFADVDRRITGLEADIQIHKSDYEEHLQSHAAAAQLPVCETAVAAAAGDLADAEREDARADAVMAAAASAYDEEEERRRSAALDTARRALGAARESLAALNGRLAQQQRDLADAWQRLSQYQALERRLARAVRTHTFFKELHQEVVRKIAQLVGSTVVASVSEFADELYARIAPEQSARLVWDPASYALELHRDGVRVRGRELSGGQLMGASLAVKLALIRWYAACRIGFLDEPTTHLDAATRRHLAAVVQSLHDLTSGERAWFDQLFIVSHEESFGDAGHRVDLNAP